MKRIVFLLFSMVLLGFTVSAQNAVMSVDNPNYDFGKIWEEDGDVTCNFVVKNTGNAPLVINRVTASCGCTTPNWTKEPIAPGATGTVTATYSAKNRPGPFSKTISVYSNGKDGAYILTIKGEVLSKAKNPEANYPVQMGDFRLKTTNVVFNSVSNQQTVNQSIQVYNNGKAPLKISFGNVPGYMTVTSSPALLEPGKEGNITIAFNAAASKKYGQLIDNITVLLDGKKVAGQTIKTTATVIDDFSNLSAAQKASAPVLVIAPASINFNNLKQEKTKIFKITNTGKSALTIHSISSSSSVISVSKGKKEIKPGETVEYKVFVDTQNVTKNISGVINIVANDPNSPTKNIYVSVKPLT